MKARLSAKVIMILITVFFLVPVQMGSCSEAQLLADKFKILITYSYLEGYNTGFCDNVGLSSRMAAINMHRENPNLSPELILLIKSSIKMIDSCCELGKLDRRTGKNNLPRLLNDVDLAVAKKHL